MGHGHHGLAVRQRHLRGHAALETALAKFYGRKHAMVFTTGYQANLGGISGLVAAATT
jgi:8-amino-7-oxononanoate synthase